MKALLIIAALSLGCGGEPTPETPAEAVSAFVSALEQSTADRGARARAYGLLSRRARESLTERANRAAQLAGRPFEPWEMLAPGRARVLVRPVPDAMITRTEGERAVVTVRGGAGATADVPLVREGGRWKLDLALPPVAPPRGDSP